MDAEKVIMDVRKQVAGCTKCKLNLSRNKVVPGEGPANSQIMFIGEAPGFHENNQGQPFVGAAGSFLDELLAKAGLKREEVFITNVIKCRPPANRDPEPEELEACRPYLDAQIEAINPKVIVTLGRFSMAYFIENGKISAIHGHPRIVNGRLVVPMYHPAAALHQPALRSTLLEDFNKIPDFIHGNDNPHFEQPEPKPITSQDPEVKPELKDYQGKQLSLFD